MLHQGCVVAQPSFFIPPPELSQKQPYTTAPKCLIMTPNTVFTIETNTAKTVYNPLFLVGKTTITQLNH